MGVSKNSGTPKSSILIGFSIIHHPFWGTPIFGNIHIKKTRCKTPIDYYLLGQCHLMLGRLRQQAPGSWSWTPIMSLPFMRALLACNNCMNGSSLSTTPPLSCPRFQQKKGFTVSLTNIKSHGLRCANGKSYV